MNEQQRIQLVTLIYFPSTDSTSIINHIKLNDCVRNGNSRDLYMHQNHQLNWLFYNRSTIVKRIVISRPIQTNIFIKANKSIRPISISLLNTLLCVHMIPINLVVSQRSYAPKCGKSNLETSFPLICFQWLSIPSVATQRCPMVGQLFH